MPTKKPIVQAVIDEKLFKKLEMICKLEERSKSYITEKAVKCYIELYEKEHGKIVIPPEEC